MGRLILVRHGETQANREKRFAISGDIPLTELGRQQARQAAGRIAMLFQPQRIFSSSFRRARETGEIIGEVLDLPVEILEGIQERDLGILKGELYGYLPVVAKASKDYDPARFWQWRPEGGESHEDVQIRMVSALQRVRHDYPD